MRIEVQANSVEWLTQRCACATASNLHKITSRLQRASNGKKKGDYKESRDVYLREVVSERLSGLAMENFVTPFMDQGLQNEPLAREHYAMMFDLEPETKYGFALHPTIEYFGASLDATVGDDGGAEYKCFKPDKHLEIYLAGEIPEENIAQVLGEMSCYELEWCDWVSYCGFGHWPRDLRLFRKRLHRGDTITFNDVTQTVDSHIADIEAEAKKFLEDVILQMGQLAKMAELSKTTV
jgi:hypothetical protein